MEEARERQKLRFGGVDAHCNGQLDGAQTRLLLEPPDQVKQQLLDAYRNGSLSLRGYDRAQVDQFKLQVAEELERLVRDRMQAEERLKSAQEQLRGYRERERAMNEALVAAQQLRADSREQAEREARSRLSPEQWAEGYAAGRLASIDALMQDIDRVVQRG